ncbi:alpha/beta hydrolase family protein [Dyadobacter jiangsuensis]
MNKKITLAAFLALIAGCIAYILLSEKAVVKKSQEPVPPYPYYNEFVTFQNTRAGVSLSGTLTLPDKKGNFPAVILITGSGAQDRDETVFGHKPFLIIADYLTRKGFAVLRYDDRGTGKSTGHFDAATSMDFATDAESAIAYLKSRKEISPNKIGLIGHSEGGLVAAIAASQSRDVSFVVSLAGPGAIAHEVMALQMELIARAGGVDEQGIAFIRKINSEALEILRNSPDTIALRANLNAYMLPKAKNYPSQMLPPGLKAEQFFKHQINSMCGPWYQYLYNINPAHFFQKVTCPVLALNGSKDLQIDTQQNLPEISKALKEGGNLNGTVKELPNLNHLFQECKTGHPSEYAGIEETFSPKALAMISDWLTVQTRGRNM